MRKIRLSEEEIKAIKESAEKIFGKGTKVCLFGSRVYPKLWEKLGEQKIDIILEKDPERPIEKIALQEGIKL